MNFSSNISIFTRFDCRLLHTVIKTASSRQCLADCSLSAAADASLGISAALTCFLSFSRPREASFEDAHGLIEVRSLVESQHNEPQLISGNR